MNNRANRKWQVRPTITLFKVVSAKSTDADTRKVKRKQRLAIFGFLFERIVELSFVQLWLIVLTRSISRPLFFILILLCCFNLQLLDYPDNPRLSQYTLWISVMSTYWCAPRSYKSTIKNVLHIRFCDNICNFLIRFNP